MPKPEIIGSLRSSYTRVVCMVCEEKDIAYTLTNMPLQAPTLRAIHPFGKMPVLRHGDFALCESKAIATYLDLIFPERPVLPSDARLSALAEQWVSIVNTTMDPILTRTYLRAYAFPNTPDGKPDTETIKAVTPAVREQLSILDRAVSTTGYLVGDQFTFADINLLPILFYLRMLPEGQQAFEASPHLADYYNRHSARASFMKTIPPIGPPGRAQPN
jgi:glutathione S-transferase